MFERYGLHSELRFTEVLLLTVGVDQCSISTTAWSSDEERCRRWSLEVRHQRRSDGKPNACLSGLASAEAHIASTDIDQFALSIFVRE